MPVVFDEVIASVEALPPAPAAEGSPVEQPVREEQDDRVLSVIETQQRWAQRLEAS